MELISTFKYLRLVSLVSTYKKFNKEEFENLSIDKLFTYNFSLDDYLASELSGWSENRQKEFLKGREIAKNLLLKLGCEEKDINLERLETKECSWPKNYCGSISHARLKTSGEYTFFVATSDSSTSLGVDVEYVERFKDQISKQFMSNQENQMNNMSLDEQEYQALIFSSKEAIFKAIFPLYQKYFHFFDVELDHIEILDNDFLSNFSILNKEIKDKIQIESIKVHTNFKDGCVFSFCETKQT